MRPRIRSLKPEMWQDERVGALSHGARLLMLGMITLADDEGRFRARRSIMHGHVFPADDGALERIDEWVEEIRKHGIVVFYIVDGTPYGAFRHWAKHQKINRPSPSELPPPPDPKIVRENRVKRQGASRERSVSTHGGFTEYSVSTHSSTRRRAFRSDPDPDPVLILCQKLGDHVTRNDPKAKPNPASERWLTDMRLLVKDRAGDIAEVDRIIDWCQADVFWRSNILSPGSLRKQFTRLVLKATEPSQVVPFGRPASAGDLINKLRAAEEEAS